jgi:hypothetical protein
MPLQDKLSEDEVSHLVDYPTLPYLPFASRQTGEEGREM